MSKKIQVSQKEEEKALPPEQKVLGYIVLSAFFVVLAVVTGLALQGCSATGAFAQPDSTISGPILEKSLTVVYNDHHRDELIFSSASPAFDAAKLDSDLAKKKDVSELRYEVFFSTAYRATGYSVTAAQFDQLEPGQSYTLTYDSNGVKDIKPFTGAFTPSTSK